MAAHIIMKAKLQLFENNYLLKPVIKSSSKGVFVDLDSSRCISASDFGHDAQVYKQVYEYFGHSLSLQLPLMHLTNIFMNHPHENRVQLGEMENKSSGEELLADLMQQIQQEQECHHQEQEHSARWGLMEPWELTDNFKQTHHDRKFSGHFSAKLNTVTFQNAEDVPLSSTKSDTSNDSEEDVSHSNFSEPLAVSSTISDPRKGTLKLKIVSKRQMLQDQNSPQQQHLVQPRLMWQINTFAEPEHHHPYQDGRERDSRHKHKRKQTIKGSNEQEKEDLYNISDPEELSNRQLSTVTSQMYSPSGDSSGSDSNPHKKRKLMLKLKVSSKESASE